MPIWLWRRWRNLADAAVAYCIFGAVFTVIAYLLLIVIVGVLGLGTGWLVFVLVAGLALLLFPLPYYLAGPPKDDEKNCGN